MNQGFLQTSLTSVNEEIFIGEFENLLPYTAGARAEAAAAVFFNTWRLLFLSSKHILGFALCLSVATKCKKTRVKVPKGKGIRPISNINIKVEGKSQM